MKRERSGVVMLLIMLLIFSATVGMLHSTPPTQQKKTDSTGELGSVSPDVAAQLLTPLMLSESVDKLVEAMVGIEINKLLPLAKKIIEVRQAVLTQDDLLKIIFGLVSHFSDQVDQFKLFDLIADHEVLQKGAPIVYVAAVSDYSQVIPVVIAWAKERANQPKIASAVNNAVYKAYEFAVTQNNLDALAQLHKQGAVIQPQQATDLLWKAVTGRKKPAIAQFLIKSAHANVNDVRKGRTPLIQATEHNNLDMVKALADAGADVNKLADDQVGTALQIAIGRSYTKIDEYLRSKGARE